MGFIALVRMDQETAGERIGASLQSAVLDVRQVALRKALKIGSKRAVLLSYNLESSPDPLIQRVVADTRTAIAHPVVEVAFNDDLMPVDIESMREELATWGKAGRARMALKPSSWAARLCLGIGRN